MARPLTAAAAVVALLFAPATAGAQSWTSAGPGPPDFAAVAFDPTQPGVAYAGTRGGWLFRSSDSGASWTRVLAVPGDEPVASIAVRGAQIVLSRPGPTFSGAGGIVRSSDGGATWAFAGPAQGIANSDVGDVVIDPASPNVVLLGTNGGLFRSVNGGATWSPVPVPTGTQIHALLADPAVPGRFFVGSNSGVSRSVDHGASFSAYNQPAPVGTGGAYALALDGGTLHATQFNGAAKTTTAGATAAWTDASSGLPPDFFSGALAVSPPRLIATGSVMYQTALAFPGWSPSPGPGFVTSAIGADAFAASRLLTGGQGGLARSTDAGVSWQRVDGGLTGLGVKHVAAAAPGSLLTGPHGTLLRSDDGGRSFQSSQTGLTSVGETTVAVDPVDPQRMLLFGSPSQLFGSADGGRTWTPRNYANTSTDGVLAYAPSDPRTVYGAGFTGAIGVAKRSEDGGATWTHAGLPTSSFNFARGLAVDSADSRLVYLSTDSGLRVSSDSGTTWVTVSGIPAGPTGEVAAHPGVPGSALVLTDAGQLWRTSDRGASWAASVIPDGSPTDVVVDPRASSTVYVATTVGVFRSLDGGATWAAVSDGLPNRRVVALAFDRGGSALYAATDAGLAVLSFAGPSPPPAPPSGGPAPVATLRPGLATLRSTRLRFDSRRRVALGLSCPAASSGCAGTARLATRRRPAKGGRRAVPAKTLASGRFSLRAGRRTTLRLSLKRFPVRPGRTLKAEVRITGAGRSRTTKVTVLRPKPSPSRRR